MFLTSRSQEYIDTARNLGEVHEVLDVDGDGDLDLFTVLQGNRWATLRNDGTGRFEATIWATGNGFDAKSADLNSDGDLDAVIARWDWTKSPATQVWLQSP